MAPVTLHDFAALQGQRFELQCGSAGPWTAELLAAQRCGGQALAGREPFSLLFRGPLQPVLPQQTYRVSGAALPAMDIFLVPVGAAPDGVRYEAVFS